MTDGGSDSTAKVTPSSPPVQPLSDISLRKLTVLEREQTPTKSSRLRLSGISAAKTDVVPASNRVSLKLAEQERLVRLARSNQRESYMISPDSMIRYWWDLLMALVTIVLIWRVPYTIAFGEGNKLYWYIFNKGSDAIYMADVILNFRTGYTEDAEVVMDSKKVAIRYIKSWFLVDLIGSIPVETIMGSHSSGVERKAIKASFKYIKIPKLFRITRLIKFVQKYMKYAYAVQVFACYITIIHWIACLWAGRVVTIAQYDDELLEYSEAVYSAVLLMLNISGVDVKPEWTFLCAVLGLVGFLFQCMTLASITAVAMSSGSRALQYQEKVRMVMSDLKALQVPVDLRKATKAYYETLWRMKNTSDRYEKAIYEDEDLSPALRSEIALYIHRSLVATVPLFQGCSDSCLACVVMKLKTQLFMRGDVVYHKGDPANSMVIISRGKVKVISPDNEGILAVLKPGSFFGEIGLLRNMTRSCTVVAGTFCELKSLERNDAEEVFDSFPQIFDRLLAEAEKRRQDTRLKAKLYNVKVLDNAHAVDVSSIVDSHQSPSENPNLQPFMHGGSDSGVGDSHTSGAKKKLVRGNSFQSEEGGVINSELDNMTHNLEEIQRLMDVLKDTHMRLARVHQRRESIHAALGGVKPSAASGLTPALIARAHAFSSLHPAVNESGSQRSLNVLSHNNGGSQRSLGVVEITHTIPLVEVEQMPAEPVEVPGRKKLHRRQSS